MGWFQECVITEIKKDINSIENMITFSQIYVFKEQVLISWELSNDNDEHNIKKTTFNEIQQAEKLLPVGHILYRNLNNEEVHQIAQSITKLPVVINELPQTISKVGDNTLKIMDLESKLKHKYEPPPKKAAIRQLRNKGTKKVFEFRTTYIKYSESDNLLYHLVLPDYCYSDKDLVFCSEKGKTIIVTHERRQSITFILSPDSSNVELVVIFFCNSEDINKFTDLNLPRGYQKSHEAISIRPEQVDKDKSLKDTFIGQKIKQNLE
jgi:hypothetical protein